MITQKKFGTLDNGQDIILFSISNKNGMQADVINYGAILVNLWVTKKDGTKVDIALGYDNLEDYKVNSPFLGAAVGPIANRTANATFSIDGTKYQLDANENGNNLHSHYEKGIHKAYYSFEVDETKNQVALTTICKDGEIGFPGNREITITYGVTDDNELIMQYDGVSDKKTILNLTNHSYFNLKGHDNASILDEELWINAEEFTEIVKGAIPTGKLIAVQGTPLDFTSFSVIGDRIEDSYEQLQMVGGYDHNFVVKKSKEGVEKVAMVRDEQAGLLMEVYSDLPGIQFYAGNFIGEHTGKNQANYGKRHGLALETQYFPNSANEESFECPITEPSKPYHTVTIYKVTTV